MTERKTRSNDWIDIVAIILGTSYVAVVIGGVFPEQPIWIAVGAGLGAMFSVVRLGRSVNRRNDNS